MEFNNIGAIIIVTLVLLTFFIIYILYVMYNENNSIKVQLDKLESDNASISVNFTNLEKNINNFMLENYQEIEEGETDETDETDEHKPDMNFFDQLLINSDDLDHLQKIQQEMRGQRLQQQVLDTIIEEVEESDNDSTSTVEDQDQDYISLSHSQEEEQLHSQEEEPIHSQEEEPLQSQEEEPEISFEKEDEDTTSTKCTQILKVGKNKGNACSKDAIRNTEFCKSHTK